MSHQQGFSIKGALAVSAALTVAAFMPPAVAQEHPPMPPGISHEEHMRQIADMKKRGSVAMGFDQDKVSHHFHLTSAGGSIEVGVNEGADGATRQQIRDHLRTISRQFADGVFTSPIATHAEVPPGVLVMRERKERIKYVYEETADGARVTIATTDRAARTALHDFLRYQIREHATGDPVPVRK